MGNCVSEVAHKYEADDEKISISHSSKQLEGLMEQSKAEYLNACRRRRSSLVHFPDDDQKSMWKSSGSSEGQDKKFIIMNNPPFSQSELRKPSNPSNFGHNIQSAHSPQRARGRGVRRLKLVISARELSELLIKYGGQIAHNSTDQTALASLVLEKLSMQGGRFRSPRENGGAVMMNSASRSTSSMQSNGNYNYHSAWRPSLEDIPEAFTEEG